MGDCFSFHQKLLLCLSFLCLIFSFFLNVSLNKNIREPLNNKLWTCFSAFWIIRHSLKWGPRTQELAPGTRDPETGTREPGLRTMQPQDPAPRTQDPGTKTLDSKLQDPHSRWSNLGSLDNYHAGKWKYWNMKYNLNSQKTPKRDAFYLNI